MKEYLPLLILGAIIGVISVIFITAYAMMKNKKESVGFDRNMKDGEIIRRLLSYALPHKWSFALAGALMLFAICYDILSPLLIARIERLLSQSFPPRR